MQAKSAEKVHHKEVAENLSLREAALQNSLPPIFDLHWQTIHNVQRGLSFQSLSLKCQSHEKNDNPLLEGDNVFSLAEDVWRHRVCVC